MLLGLAAIWSIQAGKDVYVEKPVSHNAAIALARTKSCILRCSRGKSPATISRFQIRLVRYFCTTKFHFNQTGTVVIAAAPTVSIVTPTNGSVFAAPAS